MKFADKIVLFWFVVANAATFLAFGFDKWRARRSRKRVPESTLVLLAALGGWPGGWVGMNWFGHKTAKWTFKLKYVVALLPFTAEVWCWWRWR